MDKCVSRVGIYAPNQPSKTQPFAEIKRKEARNIVAQGLAIWMDSSRNIRLTRLGDRLSDRSSSMGPAVIEACWAGRRWALVMAEGWNKKSKERAHE